MNSGCAWVMTDASKASEGLWKNWLTLMHQKPQKDSEGLMGQLPHIDAQRSQKDSGRIASH